MRSGRCPKCGQATIHAARGGLNFGGGTPGVRIRTSAMTSASEVDAFVCVACGYFETYVADPGKLAEVAQVWGRVEPQA